MQIENQYLIDELNIVRRQISTLVSMPDEECLCFDALRMIQMMEGLLNLVIVKMIHRQLNESIALIEGNPSLNKYDDELNRIIELFRTFNSRSIFYQLTINKVEHE